MKHLVRDNQGINPSENMQTSIQGIAVEEVLKKQNRAWFKHRRSLCFLIVQIWLRPV